MKTLLSATLLIAVSGSASGMAPATQLVLSNSPCLIQICPGNPPFPTTVAAGAPFRIFVAARDGTNAHDIGFVGMVVFSSSDPSRHYLGATPSYPRMRAEGNSSQFSAR